ncbi:DNRLRE domain-containing protein [Nonomuraea jabiensis]|uniref:DNRLRE domain-containing protein n=1 Tax=Nonomuraea jabiensis TaxID=882448 RepID=UPI0036AD4E28
MIALSLNSLIAATLTIFPGSPAQADPTATPTTTSASTSRTFPRPDDPDEALRAAITEAKKRGKPVEVATAASSSGRTWAYPDGHLTSDIYAGPARVKQANGEWAWIDNSLIEQDGVLKQRTPSAAAAVQFSTGGAAHPFAVLTKGDKGGRLALAWPVPLPKPVVEGQTATYTDAVGSGADLVVMALTTGFRFDILLREKPKGSFDLRLPVAAEGLDVSATPDGMLQLTDGKGRKIGHGQRPMMWDAGPERGARRTAVKVRVEKGGDNAVLVIEPDENFLNDSATKYPVTIDPTISLGLQADTWIENSVTYGNSQPSDIQLWAGAYEDPFEGTNLVDRSFLRFDSSALTGRSIKDAVLALRQHSSTGCGDANSAIKAQRITAEWNEHSLTWTNQPAATASGEAAARDTGACGAVQTMTWQVPGIAQAWASGAPNYGILLRGANESAASPDYSRVFDSAEWGGAGIPKLTVTYGLPPEVPTVTSDFVDSMEETDAIVRNGLVGLSYSSSSTDGSAIEYSMTISETTGQLTTPAPVTGPSGQTVRQSLTLGNPHSFRFAVKACVTQGVCSQTPAYRISNDAPFSPASMGADLTSPTNPILYGLLSRPSRGAVTGKFYLYDSAGAPVGPSPIGEGTVQGGQRIALRLPDGLVQTGKTYTWRLQACVQDACTDKTPANTFAVPTSPPPPPTGSATVTVDRSSIVVKSARTASDACSGSPCPLTASPAIEAGGSGSGEKLSLIRPDLGSVPEGSRVTRAVLNLGSASCAGGTCPTGAAVVAYAPSAAVGDDATGASLVQALNVESSAPAAASQPTIDVTTLVTAWLEQPSTNYGVVVRGSGAQAPVISFGGGGAGTQTSLVIEYLPPSVPGAVSTPKVRPGDAGALVTWLAPGDSGTVGGVGSYEVQALDSGSQVVKQATVTGTEAVITGLTNGVAYRFQIRAVNSRGPGPWTLSGTAVPQAVAGGAQQYLDAVRQLAQMDNELAEAKSTTVDQALATKSQAALLRALAYTTGPGLSKWAKQAAARKFGQQSSTITLADPLVAADSTGAVTVHGTVTVETVFADATGGTPVQTTADSTVEQREYLFRPNGGRPQLIQSMNADAADPGAPVGELTAEPAGSPSIEPPAEATPLAVDEAGFSDYSAGAPTPSDIQEPAKANLAGINHRGIKLWAVANAQSKAERFSDNDCTNFVSRAINQGGGAPKDFHPFASPLTRGNNNYWWQYGGLAAINLRTSYSWSAVNNWYRYWMVSKKRASWVPSWKDLRQGDILLWGTGLANSPYGHLSIVSNIDSKGRVFYAQHSGDHAYRSFEQGRPWWRGHYPNGKVYGVRINR